MILTTSFGTARPAALGASGGKGELASILIGIMKCLLHAQDAHILTKLWWHWKKARVHNQSTARALNISKNLITINEVEKTNTETIIKLQ